MPLQLLERVLADQDARAVLLAGALQPRGEVHAVADQRVVHALGRADVAGHDVVGVEADADVDRKLALRLRSMFQCHRLMIMVIAARTARSSSSSCGTAGRRRP